MSALAVIALILAAILGTYVMWRLNEPAVRTTVSLVERVRVVLGILFLGLAAYHAFRSGNVLYVALGAAGVAFITGYALVEEPWDDTI